MIIVRRTNNGQKVVGESKKSMLSPYKLANVLGRMRVPNYDTIRENKPNGGAIKNFK